MDGDFQTNYLAAEQAYSAGDFEAARKITLELLSQLEPVPDEGAERDAVLAWRAFVALLAGHISLYGFQDASQAENFYRLVLTSNPQDTLRELAAHGLERTRHDQEPEPRIHPQPVSDPIEDASTEPVTATGSSALIADPFLSEASTRVNSVQTTVITTATPWLKDEQSVTAPDQAPSSQTNTVAAPEPEAVSEPESQPIDEPEPQPMTPSVVTEINDLADPEPETVSVPQPSDEPKPQPDTSVITEINVSEPEPEAESEALPNTELVESTATDIVTVETNSIVISEMSDEIQKRLEAGRLVVKLPDRALPPSEHSSDSGQAKTRWSWLRAALSRR